MPSFGIKSLMYLTALVAAGALFILGAVGDNLWTMFLAQAMFASIVAYSVIRDLSARKKAMMAEREDQEKRPE
jgi:hypothetical protein